MAERGPRARTLLHLGARALVRDLRNPHFIIVVLALVVAVAAMTAVATFTDRIARALTQQASHLLAGDLVLQATRPLDAQWVARAAALGLANSAQLGMRSMVSYDGGVEGRGWRVSAAR
jgi:putative ABC transport system permease protein